MPVIVLELELGAAYKPAGGFDFAGQVLWRIPAPGGKTLALKRRRRAQIKAWGAAKRNPREQLIVDQALKERLMLGVGGPFSSSALELFQSSGSWCGPFLGFRFTPPQASEAFAPPAHPLSQY
jgi:hypothetical protein